MRRVLVATALIEGDEKLLDADDKPLKTEKSVRDAVARVTRDVQDMAAKYTVTGWTADGDIEYSVTPDDIVIGRLYLTRED